MGGRPEKPKKPLLGYTGAYMNEVRSADLFKVIYKKALAEEMWIYDPSTKRWFSPEEFWENYQRYDNVDLNWIEALEIRDPQEGLLAADKQIEHIITRKAIFGKRIIDYWKAKRRDK